MRQLTKTDLPKFSEIKPQNLITELSNILAELRKTFQKIIAQPGPYTWENLLEPLEIAEDQLLHRFWLPITHLSAVTKSNELLRVAKICDAMIIEYQNEIRQNTKWREALLSILNNTNYFNTLNDYQKTAINETIKFCNNSGSTLTNRVKDRITQLQKDLALLETTFSDNVHKANTTTFFHLPTNCDVSGISDDILEEAKEAAEDLGETGYYFSLENTTINAILQNARNRDLREAIYKFDVSRASEDNFPVIQSIVNKRLALAKIYNYDSYANWRNRDDISKSADHVMRFLNQLITAAKPAANREFQALQKFAAEKLGIDNLKAWDIDYTTKKMKESIQSCKNSVFEDYFSLPTTLNGLFDLLHKFYGTRFEHDENVDAYDEDVQFYRVYDQSDNLIAGIYFDFFERSDKDNSCWMSEGRNRCKLSNGDIQLPIAFVNCDFTEPSNTKKPALLSHEEVISLFHETGHALQHIFTQSNVPSVCGISSVPQCAVEIPSLYLENFAKQPEVLERFAKHYKTNKSIPDALLEKLMAAQTFQPATELLTQLEFALFDMQIHSHTEPVCYDTIKACIFDVRRKTDLLCTPRYNHMEASFNHIFSGAYGASYHAYILSEAWALALIHKSTPQAVKETLLSYGGCRPQSKMLEECTGQSALSPHDYLAYKGIPTRKAKLAGKRHARQDDNLSGFFNRKAIREFTETAQDHFQTLSLT